MSENTQDASAIELAPIADAQVADVMLDDYRPLIESLDWRVAQAYWHLRGTQAFTTHEIPNLINNNGMRAHKAADVFFEHLLEIEERGDLELKIEVAEIAIGLGLHARFFLDRLRDRCKAEDKDYYDRITFYATDISRKTLEDIQYQETLSPHGSRVRFGHIDAKKPGTFIDYDDGTETDLTGRIRLYINNYVLSLLPFNLLWRSKDWWGELRIRTNITDVGRLGDVTHHNVDGLRVLAARGDDDALAELSKLYSFFRLARAFFTIDLVDLPFGREIRRFADEVLQPFVNDKVEPGADVRLVSPRGAVWALEAMLKAMRPDGFLMFHDFGAADLTSVVTTTAHSRFGGSAAMSLNFPFIDHYMRSIRAEPANITAPPGDEASQLHARLVSLDPLPNTHKHFEETFDKARFDAFDEVVADARKALEAKDLEAARRAYKKAHEMHPEHWSILLEWSRLEIRIANDVRRCAELCEKALALNPTGDASLWCEYGDAVYYLGAFTASHQAYERAVSINPESPRAHFNLAWTHVERGNISEALVHCGHALAVDLDGVFQKRTLQLQTQILERKNAKREAEVQRLKNRFST